MKTSLLIFIAFFLFRWDSCFAVSYNDTIPLSENSEYISDELYEKVYLLESYVHRYRKKILSHAEDLGIRQSLIIQESNDVLRKMETSLEFIQDNPVNQDVVDNVMRSVLSDIETMNQRIQVYLQQEEILYKKRLFEKKQTYIAFANTIYPIVDNFINEMSISLISYENLGVKQKEIVYILSHIRDLNMRLKSFHSKDFSQIHSMEKYFLGIIRSLQEEFQKLQNLS